MSSKFPANKLILALSRDRGSIQAIVPVLSEITKIEHSSKLRIFIPQANHQFIKSQGLHPELLPPHKNDESQTNCLASLFEQSAPDLLLTGSSPRHDLSTNTPEGLAIIEARKRGIPSISVLDYWGMYEERFHTNDGKLNLDLIPDILCVLDVNCKDDLISLGIPPERIQITHNPWLDRIATTQFYDHHTLRIKTGNGLKAAFISQPLKQFTQQYGANLNYQIASNLIRSFPEQDQHELLILSHPADDSTNWTKLQDESSGNVKVNPTDDRSYQFLQNLDFVATAYSTLAHEILHLGTPCFSLRFGYAFPKQYSDMLGLSIPVESTNALTKHLKTITPSQMRECLAHARQTCTRKKLFFSDGHAVKRVIECITSLLT